MDYEESEIELNHGDDLARASVTDVLQVIISGYRDRVQLPHLSPTVKSLVVHRCTLTEDSVVSEGVQELTLEYLGNFGPLPRLPQSLTKLTMRFNAYPVVDLGEAKIMTFSAKGEQFRELVLPLGLVSLSLDTCVNYQALSAVMPRSLREVQVYNCRRLESLGGLGRVPITSFRIGGDLRLRLSNLHLLLSRVESLIFDDYIGELPEISLPKLRHLSIVGCADAHAVELNSPKLESLVINRCPLLEVNEIYAGTVQSLSLIKSPKVILPDWPPRLEKLVIDQVGDLPYMPELQYLGVLGSTPRTNGKAVRDIAEYRQAWGYGRAKRPTNDEDRRSKAF